MIDAVDYINKVYSKHEQLTLMVVAIIENLLNARQIDYLTVTGRTKDKQGAIEKCKRKNYSNPSLQLTDLSGIRVIVYFESDIAKVSEIITTGFNVDEENSLNQSDLLSVNQIGYRSVHFVCDLGEQRSKLPEFATLSQLKFEFQVRTALQHAWAELAHDRNYKFSGKLPKTIERNLFLYAGMLEIADKGFDNISKQIDSYIEQVSEKSAKGDLSTEINSLSLAQFVESWAESTGLQLDNYHPKDDYASLIHELKQFEIFTLSDLNNIVPEQFTKVVKETSLSQTILGVVRDWMLISDWRKFKEKVHCDWKIDPNEYYDYMILYGAFVEDPEELLSNFIA